MVALQDGEGLVFWPEWEIASWMPDFQNRWRAVRCNGEVAHRPTPPPAGPWVPLGMGLVLPQLLTRCPEGWKDPAGFLFPPQELPAVPGPPASLAMPGLPFTEDQLFLVSRKPGGNCEWNTDVGQFSTPRLKDNELRALHPNLLRISGYRYLNWRRLRRILRKGTHLTFQFENGEQFREWLSPDHATQLGLPNLVHLEPRRPGLYSGASLRDWPFELATASAETLRRHFSTPRHLIANVIWQAYRYLCAGHPGPYGTSHRDFWYEPLVSVLERAGMLSRAETKWRIGDRDSAFGKARKLYHLYERILGDCVIPWGFFTLREFGFADGRPDMRHIGDRLPTVVIVAEKKSLRRTVERLSREFGTSYLILSGQPSLLATEYLALALQGLGPIRVVALVDYDPAGYVIGESVVDQLRYFGAVVSDVEFVMRPDLFTTDEIELLALPCKMNTLAALTHVKHWLEKGGGINGMPLGIHVNHLRPYERVRSRLASLLC